MPIPDANTALESLQNFLKNTGIMPKRGTNASDFDALMEGIEGATRSMPPQYGAPLLGAVYTGQNIGPILRRMRGLPEEISEGARFAMAKYPRLSRNLKATWKELAEMFPARLASEFDPGQLTVQALIDNPKADQIPMDKINDLGRVAARNYQDFTKAVDQQYIPGVERIANAFSKNRARVNTVAADVLSDVIDPSPNLDTVNRVAQNVLNSQGFIHNVIPKIEYAKLRNGINTFIRNLPEEEQLSLKELQEFHADYNAIVNRAKQDSFNYEEFIDELLEPLLGKYGFTNPKNLINQLWKIE